MLDIGTPGQILFTIIVALLVIRPKDLPTAIRTVGEWIGKMKSLAREFREGLDQVAREVPMQDIKNQIESVTKEIESATIQGVTGEQTTGMDQTGEKSFPVGLLESKPEVKSESISAPSKVEAPAAADAARKVESPSKAKKPNGVRKRTEGAEAKRPVRKSDKNTKSKPTNSASGNRPKPNAEVGTTEETKIVAKKKAKRKAKKKAAKKKK
ncbi:MAG: twin-arginine translocase TatA/TatE family subunit [Alphaproteobacteria bacterium]